VFALRRPASIEVTAVEVQVTVQEQVATTTMTTRLRNPGNTDLAAELMVPVPDGAVVRGLACKGADDAPNAEVLRKAAARETYEALASAAEDPALLEFVNYNLVRTSVFPVQAGRTQSVRLTYEHLLPSDGGRIDYLLPRTESIDYRVPWNISVETRSAKPIATVYSPTHDLETKRPGPNAVSVTVAASSRTVPGPFRLSYLLQQDGLGTSLLAYPEPRVGGGYFLLLAGLPTPSDTERGRARIKREVSLVIDRSGSMHGEKMRQVRDAALKVIDRLEDGEAFNIMVYGPTVEPFSPKPVLKSKETVEKARRYLSEVQARGGTNIHDALANALQQKPARDMLPIVLFLTDGLPTIGQTEEVAIRNLADQTNPYGRRVFTFGVGVDVNSPLLQSIANRTRASANVVLPKQDVEAKVAQVFERLTGPILASPKLAVLRRDGEPASGRIADAIPSKLPDVFEGGQLVVLGRYLREDPLTFRLTGNHLGKERTFQFPFDPRKATTLNGFVARLWASRRIGVLVDAIREAGAGEPPFQTQAAPQISAETQKLIDEVVRLSTEFGILTEYTAFLAREGTDLTQRKQVQSEVGANFGQRAMRIRSGISSWNQELNSARYQNQLRVNLNNDYLDANLDSVSITTVQQVNDRAFYLKNGIWVDSRIVDRQAQKPAKVVRFGSRAFRKLTDQLAEQGRQGCLSLNRDTVLLVDDKSILIKQPSGTHGIAAQAKPGDGIRAEISQESEAKMVEE